MTLALLIAAALLVPVRRRALLPSRRETARVRSRKTPDHLRLALLLQIGLTAGLTVRASLAAVAKHLDSTTRAAIDDVLREGLLTGLDRSLRSDRHGRLFQILADAHAAGAPAELAVATFVADEIDRLRSAATEQARTLPIKLAVPLTLCLLPGFVLLAVAPQIVLALRQMLTQVAGL